MAGIFQFTAVAVTIAVVFAVGQSALVLAEQELPHVLRLPSEAPSGEDQGVCAGKSKPSSCPVKCFRTDPVCGVDGKTYWCGCAEAECAGAKVAKLGFCDVGSGGSAPLSAQALLLVHIVWLILLGFSVLFGLS